MSIYRLSLAVPATGSTTAYSEIVSDSDNRLQECVVTLRKEKAKSSYLTAAIWDPDRKTFAKLPDPAYFNVPLTLDWAAPGRQQPVRVFEGIITSIATDWGVGAPVLHVTAHDLTIEARRQATAKTLSKMKPNEAIKQILKAYDFDVDEFLDERDLIQRALYHALPGHGAQFLSDWDFCARIAAAEGLQLYSKGKKVYIRSANHLLYGTTFKPGDGKVQSIRATINHVRGPGSLGNIKGQVALDNQGTEKALKGDRAKAAGHQGGEGRTHQRPVGGADASANKASTEFPRKWTNQAILKADRKDACALRLNPEPDLNLYHVVPLDGFGGKIDGNWEVAEIQHELVPSDQGSFTAVNLVRPTGKSKQTGALAGGVAFASAGTK